VPTEKQAMILLELFGANANLAEAARQVSNSKFSRQIAQKIKRTSTIRWAAREALDAVGLTDGVLVMKCVQMLNAKIKKYDKSKEEFVDCEDNATQLKALTMLLEIKGLRGALLDDDKGEDVTPPDFDDGPVITDAEVAANEARADGYLRVVREADAQHNGSSSAGK